MTTQEVANKLVELCSKGKYVEAVEALYGKDIVSVEAMAMPGSGREMKGIDAVKKKGEGWTKDHEVHSSHVEGPLVSENHFCVRFKLDVTNKPSGKRMQMDELGVYQVADGKVVREEFFYQM